MSMIKFGRLKHDAILLIDLSIILIRVRGLKAKLTIFLVIVLSIILRLMRMLRVQNSFVTALIRRIELIRDDIVRSTVFNIDGCKFVVPDFVSLWALSPYVEHFVYEMLFLTLNVSDIFVDIGAHIGKYTIPLGRVLKKGLVIALEPHPLNFYFLQKNVELNELSNVMMFNVAAFSRDGLLPLYIGRHSSTHSLIRQFAESSASILVRAEKLDTLIHNLSLSRNLEVSRIRFIKIDVEGAELEVLKGMQRILSEICPCLIVEVKGENLKELFNTMNMYSYRCKELIDKRTKGFTGYFLCKHINSKEH